MISRFDSSVFPGVASQVQGLEAYAEARWQDLRLEGELNHHLACIPSSDNKCFERFWIGRAFSQQWRQRLPRIFAVDSEDGP
jgi:hypothetical protein